MNGLGDLRRVAATILAVIAIGLAGSVSVSAASPQAGQCAGYNDPANTKVDTSDDSIVLAAGLTVCIHASNGNTGTFVTDGTSTLGEYIVASGLLNEGGQVPGVSNYVIYGGATSSPPVDQPTPTPTITAEPSATPTTTPTTEPSAEPSASASPSLTPGPTDTPIGDSDPDPLPTPPSTDTADEAAARTVNPLLSLALLVLSAVIGFGATLARVRNR